MKRKDKTELSAVRLRWQRFWHYARPIATWLLSIGLVAVIVIVAVRFVLSHYISAVDPDDATPYEVVIPQNASASKIADMLYHACGEGEKGLIASSASFKVYVDFVGKAKKRREAGEEVLADDLYKVCDRFNHNDVRPITMWMVLYTREFGLDEAEDMETKKYLDPFNGIIMWTWEEKDVPLIPEKFEIFKRLTPNCRRMFGCYLYNFGERKQATAEAVRWQLDFYREKILSGEAEGVVLHTNTMADMDYEAYDAAVEWMELHGDEEVADL